MKEKHEHLSAGILDIVSLMSVTPEVDKMSPVVEVDLMDG